MTQLNLKHHSGVGQFVGLGQFFCLCGDRKSFSSNSAQIWTHCVGYAGKEGDPKSFISWGDFQLPIFSTSSVWTFQEMCKGSVWQAMSCGELSRHHPQRSSPDFTPRHHPQISSQLIGRMEWRRIFHRFGRSARSGSEYFAFTPGQRNLVSLYGNPGAPPRALSTRRFPCPQSFLTHSCAWCLRALLTPPILSTLQPNPRAGSSTRSPGCCGWLCVFISILINSMTLGWREGLWGWCGNLLLNSVISASVLSHFGLPSSALLFF